MAKSKLQNMTTKELIESMGTNILPEQIYCILKDPFSLYIELMEKNIDINNIDIESLLYRNEGAFNNEKIAFCTVYNLKKWLKV